MYVIYVKKYTKKCVVHKSDILVGFDFSSWHDIQTNIQVGIKLETKTFGFLQVGCMFLPSMPHFGEV